MLSSNMVVMLIVLILNDKGFLLAADSTGFAAVAISGPPSL